MKNLPDPEDIIEMKMLHDENGFLLMFRLKNKQIIETRFKDEDEMNDVARAYSEYGNFEQPHFWSDS